MLDDLAYECTEDRDIILEFCWLVDVMLKDIQHLESETVRTRYELSCYLQPPYDEYLRSDILSDLAGQYTWSSAYKQYIQLLYNNQDPMDSNAYAKHMFRLAHGIDSSEY